MKKILLTLLYCCLTIVASYAQESKVSTAVQRWQGMWKGVADGDTTTLYLIQTVGPAEQDLKDKNFIGIYGWHSIKQKGRVIESSIDNVSNKWNDKVTVTAGYKHLSDSLHLIINDLTRNMLLGADMILLNENEAILKTWMKETWRNDNKVYPSGQTFPQEIRLFRQVNGGRSL